MAPRWTYSSFGCAAFADNGRTYAYYQWALENNLFDPQCCPDIRDCSCDLDASAWTDPVTDNMPWIDPNLPESQEFLGVMILKVTGARSSTLVREVSDAFGDGSVLGRPRKRGRSFVYEMLVIGTSCAGVDYGLEWLRKLTESTLCACDDVLDACSACTGRQLSLRVYCSDNQSCDTGLRTWDSVGVVDGVTEVDDEALRKLCCCVRKATMTLQSESPYSFTCEEEKCNEEADPDAYQRCFDFSVDCFACETCSSCDRCGRDSLCNCNPLGDLTIEVPESECFCVPMVKTFQCCCLDDLEDDSAITIELYSGNQPSNEVFTDLGLRNVTIKVFDNPDNLDCIVDDETYDDWAAVCDDLLRFELQVAYIPSDSTLTIDGRRERVVLDCDGTCRPFDQVVTSTNGQIFPLISNCGPIMVCIEFDLYNTQFSDAGGDVPSGFTVTTNRRWLN